VNFEQLTPKGETTKIIGELISLENQNMVKQKLFLLFLTIGLLPYVAIAQNQNFKALVDSAWTAINTQYLDATFNGVDWPGLRHELLAKDYFAKQEAYAAIDMMLKRLNDPATRFLTKEQFAAMLAEFSGGSLEGTGLIELLCVDINEQTKKLTVVTPLPNTPAAQIDLHPRDEIEAIDDVPTAGMSLADAMRRLRGSKGTLVKLTIRRQGKTFAVNLRREAIAPSSPVQAFMREAQHQKIGYVALQQFTPSSGQEMRQAIAGLAKDGASGFVLDLRNNPGGFVPACQEVAGIFLGQKPIAKVLGRGSNLTDLSAQGEKLTDKPVVVLVNEGTASAAEVVAGVLQDEKRAIVVGTRTFGKGLVHDAQQLADSSALMITGGRLRTLKGRDILNDAIMPDEVVAAPESPILNPSRGEPASHQDVQYLRAVEILLKRQNGFGQNY
jgi:carboxyl-terminal processing protease